MKSVKNIILKPISKAGAIKIVEKYHYSHKISPTSQICLGAYYNNILSGVIIYGIPIAAKTFQTVNNTKAKECLELQRLALSPEMAKNSESRVISISLKIIKKRYPHIKWIVSFADENQNHLGIIYQATNWIYTGEGSGMNIYVKNGKKYHNRNVSRYKRLYNLNEEDLIKVGFEILKQKKKHRYYYFLHQECKKDLKYKILPYPKV